METNLSSFKDFSYCFTSDLDITLTIKIFKDNEHLFHRLSLEGFREQDSYSDLLEYPEKRFAGVNLAYRKSDLYISVQLFSNGLALSEKIRTRYQYFGKSWCWNEVLTFPIKLCQLPVDSYLCFTVHDIVSPTKKVVIGACCLELFTSNCKLRRGLQKLTLKEIEPDLENLSDDELLAKLDPIYYFGKQWDEIDRLDKAIKKQESGDLDRVEWLDKLAQLEIERTRLKETLESKQRHLYIELQKFDFPVVFRENEANLPVPSIPRGGANLIAVADMEQYLDNPVEAKHRRLVRANRSERLDRDLKPNAKNRDQLYSILGYPPTQVLNAEEKDLIWKYRFYLTRDKKALTKFLKCVVWSDSREVEQAVAIMASWVDIDVDDALELLGRSFTHPLVRAHAVRQLEKAHDEDLLLYLLQLVQALKFESAEPELETEHPHTLELSTDRHTGPNPERGPDSTQQGISPLGEFLIKRSLDNPILGNLLIWYLRVEGRNKHYGELYTTLLTRFLELAKQRPNGDRLVAQIEKQTELVHAIFQLSKAIRESKDPRPKKIEKFRALLSDPKCKLNALTGIPFPLDATVRVFGVIPEQCTIFKSNLLPLKLIFRTQTDTVYPVMFKYGDDLRQDQLVIQIIELMDTLLRKENLDLKLSPYKVLATGSSQGLIQFVPSTPLATLLRQHDGSLLSYLRLNHPDSQAPLGVTPDVLDNYLKSCAGYCVITYLLGVGDRHLDNLLLTPDGKLFHIDFGYFLGRDPKPFPPPMKLCKEMIDAMGGASSPHYARFLSFCFVAFTSLRKSANLILNLMSLMLDADIPDIAIEPDKAVMKVQEKFCLDLNDEEAISYFQTLIQESVSALFPQVIETIHKWAQYWRE